MGVLPVPVVVLLMILDFSGDGSAVNSSDAVGLHYLGWQSSDLSKPLHWP